MNYTRPFYRQVVLWLSLVALVFALGCGTSSEPAAASPPALGVDSLAPVGNQVGDRITPFTLRLSDGSTVTSSAMLDENQPTMLFFFKRG